MPKLLSFLVDSVYDCKIVLHKNGGIGLKRVMMIGASGLVGRALFERLCLSGFETAGTFFSHPISASGELVRLDIGDLPNAKKTIRDFHPDAVVSCVGGRDFAQQLAFHQVLAQLAKTLCFTVYYCSSGNAVTGGMRGPYYEDCTLSPDCEYGQYKARCETMLQSLLPGKVGILRLPQIWGARSAHFTGLKKLIAEGRKIEIYPNLVFNVNSDRMLALQIEYIVTHGLTGVFHPAASDTVLHGIFIRTLLKRIGQPEAVFDEKPDAGNIALLSKRTFPPELRTACADVITECVPTEIVPTEGVI